jgi:hypothetical protein
MLLLDSARTVSVDGVTALPDSDSGSLWWTLAAPVALARRGPSDTPQFTLIEYKQARPTPDGTGGHGFLMFESELRIPDATMAKLAAAVRPLSDGEPRFVPVQFTDGTVSCVALDLEGSGGAVQPGSQPGTFVAVEKILGARKPSFGATNNAAFSLQLSQDGAVILHDVFAGGGAPVGVLYNLTYVGLRPALDVTLTADLDRVYNHFSASIEGQYAWLKGSVEAALDFLQQTGAITIQVKAFTTAADREDKEKWVKDFFAQNLLKQWFEPTFTPAQAAQEGSGIKVPTVDDVKKAAEKVADKVVDKAVDAVVDKVTGDAPKDGAAKPADAKPAAGEAKPAATATVTTAHKPAAFEITGRTPNPTPDGFSVAHTAATAGTSETLRLSPAGATATSGGKPVTVAADGTLAVDVAPGATTTVTVSWPAAAAKTETFTLFFDYDEPAEDRFAVAPPSALYKSYLDGSPDDDRFKGSHAPSGDATLTGAAALRAWVGRLAQPRKVSIESKASYEGHDDTPTATHNKKLSVRRALVAKGILGTLADVSGSVSTGQELSRTETPQGDPNDRFAAVTGVLTPAREAVSMTLTLTRPADPAPKPEDPKKDEPKDPKDDGTKDDKKDDTKDDKKDDKASAAALSFKLKFVHQEERKKVTINYNRQEAVERTYAPQGFFGLLVADLADKDKHFFSVDGDAPFFRTMTLTLDAPFDLGALGITSAQVAVDYGAPGAVHHRHFDALFTPADHGERSFVFFLNETADLTYTNTVQLHFDPSSGWDGNDVSFEGPSTTTADRTLLLNPFEHFEFRTVDLVPGRIDADVVRAIDVELSLPTSTTPVTRTFTIRPGGADQQWKVRTDLVGTRQVTVSTLAHLADGSTRAGTPFTTSAPRVEIDDPFSDALDIELVPVLDPATTRMGIVDVEYADLPNNYHRVERVTVPADSKDLVGIRIALLDPAKRDFSFRLTVIGVDGAVRRDPFVTTSDTLVAVQ